MHCCFNIDVMQFSNVIQKVKIKEMKIKTEENIYYIRLSKYKAKCNFC